MSAILASAPVGTRVRFAEERSAYTVQARSERYLVCTKPFPLKQTVLYTVVDLDEGVRGTENLVLGAGAETADQCERMARRLARGETSVSHRNRVPLNVTAVEWRATE